MRVGGIESISMTSTKLLSSPFAIFDGLCPAKVCKIPMGTLRKNKNDIGLLENPIKIIRAYFLVQPINLKGVEGRVEFCGIDGARVNTHNTFVYPAI